MNILQQRKQKCKGEDGKDRVFLKRLARLCSVYAVIVEQHAVPGLGKSAG